MANEIKRIEKEFILKNMCENRTPLEIHVGAERLQAFIDKTSENRLWLRLSEDIFPEQVDTGPEGNCLYR